MNRLLVQISAVVFWFATIQGQPACSVPRSTVDFGLARVGRAVLDSAVLGNVGTADLVVDRLDLGTTAFSIPAGSVTGSFTLRAGEGRTLTVRFIPPSQGGFLDTLRVHSNAPPFALPLAGRGVRSTVVIDEVLADPAAGQDGDANGDGVRDSYQDEFIEILNIGPRPEPIGGWRLSDDDTSIGSQFSFPSGTVLMPGARAVLFGGGAPAGIPGIWFTDDGRIGNGLTNAGDTVWLVDPAGPDTLDGVTFGGEGDRDQSLVRQSEAVGGFVPHGEPPGDGSRFSPGRPRAILDRVIVSPADISVALGDSLAWRATGSFTDGRTRDLTSSATWASSDSLVVWVSKGRGRAMLQGRADITARAAGVGGPPSSVTVHPPEPTGLALAPAETTVVVGGRVVYRTEAVLSDGSRFRIVSGLTWTLSDSTVAGFEGEVTVRARGAGETAARISDGRRTSPTALLRVVRMGDLNATAGVEVADALRLIDLILEVPPPATRLERAAADMNGDARVDVSDLAGIIDVMLGRPWPPSGKPAVGTPLYEARAGGPDGMVELLLEAEADLVAVQVDLSGNPEQIEAVCRGEGLVLRRGKGQADGRVRLILCDVSGTSLPRGGDVVLRFSGGQVEGVAGVQGGRMVEAAPRTAGGSRGPKAFGLRPIFPNPANAGVAVRYDLPDKTELKLDLYDVLGRHVATLDSGVREAGTYVTRWSGRDGRGRPVGSGVYFCRLAWGRRVDVRKMVWVK